MVKTKQQRALTILIFAALAVAVGCGDGKRNARGKVDRSASAQGKTADNKTAPGANAPGKQEASAGVDKQATNDAKTNEQMDAIYKAQISGTAISAAQLEEGTYEMVGVSSDFQHGQTSKLSVRAIRTDDVVPNQPLQTVADQTAAFGTFEVDGGRNVQVPYRFSSADGKLDVKKSNDDWVYVTKVVKNSQGKVATDAKFGRVAGTTITASVADLLAGAKVDNVQIPATITIVRAEAGYVRFVLSFNEAGRVATKADDKSAIVSTRAIVFTYKKTDAKPAEQLDGGVIKTSTPPAKSTGGSADTEEA